MWIMVISFDSKGRRISNPEIKIPMSPEQLLSEIKKDPSITVKKIIMDNMKSGKGKHRERIYQAAISNPELINQCVRDINISNFGKDFPIEEMYRNLDFNDIAANEKLLEFLGFDKAYAKDPKIMKGIFNLFDAESTWATSGVCQIKDKNTAKKLIETTTANHNLSGKGSNNARSAVGGGEAYADQGLMTIKKFLLTYNGEQINNVADYMAQLERLNGTTKKPANTILSEEKQKAINTILKQFGYQEFDMSNSMETLYEHLNGFQQHLNKDMGIEKADKIFLDMYKNADLPFHFNSRNYRNVNNIGESPDIISGGYIGGSSIPVGVGTKNSALPNIRMEGINVFDVLGAANKEEDFNLFSKYYNYYNKAEKLSDAEKLAIKDKLAQAESLVRNDWQNLHTLSNIDIPIPYYMSEQVLPSNYGKTLGKELNTLQKKMLQDKKEYTKLADEFSDFLENEVQKAGGADANNKNRLYDINNQIKHRNQLMLLGAGGAITSSLFYYMLFNISESLFGDDKNNEDNKAKFINNHRHGIRTRRTAKTDKRE